MSDPRRQTDFGAWFQATFGAEFPVKLVQPLLHLRDTIWISASLECTPLSVPMTANCPRPPGNFLMAGFWGHSVNSHAFYLIGRSDEHQLFFRLHFGGAYGDPRREAERIVAFLAGYQTWRAEWLSRLGSSDLLHEMGASTARLILDNGTAHALDDPPAADPAGFWQRLASGLHNLVDRVH
jgi:hypothetical protein